MRWARRVAPPLGLVREEGEGLTSRLSHTWRKVLEQFWIAATAESGTPEVEGGFVPSLNPHSGHSVWAVLGEVW